MSTIEALALCEYLRDLDRCDRAIDEASAEIHKLNDQQRSGLASELRELEILRRHVSALRRQAGGGIH